MPVLLHRRGRSVNWGNDVGFALSRLLSDVQPTPVDDLHEARIHQIGPDPIEHAARRGVPRRDVEDVVTRETGTPLRLFASDLAEAANPDLWSAAHVGQLSHK